MQYSLYAFIPFGVLLVTVSITAGIALWPGKSRGADRNAALLRVKQRSSAEILYFPTQPGKRPALQAAPRRAAEGNR